MTPRMARCPVLTKWKLTHLGRCPWSGLDFDWRAEENGPRILRGGTQHFFFSLTRSLTLWHKRTNANKYIFFISRLFVQKKLAHISSLGHKNINNLCECQYCLCLLRRVGTTGLTLHASISTCIFSYFVSIQFVWYQLEELHFLVAFITLIACVKCSAVGVVKRNGN